MSNANVQRFMCIDERYWSTADGFVNGTNYSHEKENHFLSDGMGQSGNYVRLGYYKLRIAVSTEIYAS